VKGKRYLPKRFTDQYLNIKYSNTYTLIPLITPIARKGSHVCKRLLHIPMFKARFSTYLAWLILRLSFPLALRPE
jgi:hypothetical protein